MDTRELARLRGETFYCGGCEELTKQLYEARLELALADSIMRSLVMELDKDDDPDCDCASCEAVRFLDRHGDGGNGEGEDK